MTAIDVAGLRRSFGDKEVLAGVDLRLERGGVFGLLGPNGSGKTTTVRVLTGVLRPDGASRLRVLGHDLPQHVAQLRPQIGVQTDTALYERLTATQNLVYFGRLYGMDRRRAEAAAAGLLARFGLADRAGDKVGAFSKGMKQKTLIARALIADPELVFLDEPTAGLDPEAAHELMTYIRAVSAEAGTAFFIASHRLEEMESVCTAVGILSGGTIVAAGAPEQVAAAIVPEVRVRVTAAPGARVDVAQLGVIPGVTGAHATPDGARVLLADRAQIPAVLRRIAALPVDLLGVAEDQPTLEEAYLRLVAAP